MVASSFDSPRDRVSHGWSTAETCDLWAVIFWFVVYLRNVLIFLLCRQHKICWSNGLLKSLTLTMTATTWLLVRCHTVPRQQQKSNMNGIDWLIRRLTTVLLLVATKDMPVRILNNGKTTVGNWSVVQSASFWFLVVNTICYSGDKISKFGQWSKELMWMQWHRFSGTSWWMKNG